VAESEAVVAGDGTGFAGEAELVKDRVHEVAGSVTGEGSAGAVGSVSAWSETEDEDTCSGVAEARHGPGPVGLVLIGAAFCFTDALAVVAEAGAPLTRDD
jgi:hypothetical protein